MRDLASSALAYSAEECARSIKLSLGLYIGERQSLRVAERTIRAYLDFNSKYKSGSRMKAETSTLLSLQVGEYCVITATCRANLHGQCKTVRRKLENESLKFRFENLGNNQWRVERRPDGSFNKFKDPTRNTNAVRLAAVGLEKATLFPEYTESWQILSDFTKAKARAILNNPEATWRGKRTVHGYWIIRTN